MGVVDVALAKRRCRRRVVAGIGNFLTPGWSVAESELILTAPRRAAWPGYTSAISRCSWRLSNNALPSTAGTAQDRLAAFGTAALTAACS